MTVTFRKWLVRLGALIVFMVIATAALVAYLVPARAPLPKPNGYDDLVAASEQVSGQVGDYHQLDYGELEDLISANATSLRLLRIGLARQCRVPLEPGLTNISGLMNDLAGMKRLAQLLAAEGRLKEMDNQPGQAASSYIDAIRLGNEMSRGGFLITRLVGIACEAIGYQPLAK